MMRALVRPIRPRLKSSSQKRASGGGAPVGRRLPKRRASPFGVLWGVWLVISLALFASACSGSRESIPEASTTSTPPTTTASVATTAASQLAPRTIVVDNTGNAGPGTLRQALLDARPGDVIGFDPVVFDPSAPATISVLQALPPLSQGEVTIDASDAGVILDGSTIDRNQLTHGLIVASSENTIRGLGVVGFSESGIALLGGAENVIGGDPAEGAVQWGQGNFLDANQFFGVGVWGDQTESNTITGNYIGTNPAGDGSGNVEGGVFIDLRAHHNLVGPGNVIAHNGGEGVAVGGGGVANTITENSIYDNARAGIVLRDGGNTELRRPLILDFDLAAGTVDGLACADCVVEVFSSSDLEGEQFEGSTTADGFGEFSLTIGASLTGPFTATATSVEGDTSAFSDPTVGPAGSGLLQQGNQNLRVELVARAASELEDNKISVGASLDAPRTNLLGATWADSVSLDVKEWDTVPVTGAYSRFEVPGYIDEAVSAMAEFGLEMVYSLAYWDEKVDPGPCYARFRDEAEVERYLEYIEFIVRRFGDRIRWYEMINEPRFHGCGEYNQQHIDPADYLALVPQVLEVVQKVKPDAKLIVGANVFLHDREYFMEIVESDLIDTVDGISWHPFYGTSPVHQSEFYYEYDDLVREVQDIAAANGFDGIYMAQEIGWATIAVNNPNQPIYRDMEAAKYHLRGLVIHRGLDVIAGIAGDGEWGETEWAFRRVLGNLSTLMAGVEPTEIPVEVEINADLVRSYTFGGPDGEVYLALWTDGSAVDEDPGVAASVRFPRRGSSDAVGVDLLKGFSQELEVSTVGQDLAINNLIVKDYPLFIRVG